MCKVKPDERQYRYTPTFDVLQLLTRTLTEVLAHCVLKSLQNYRKFIDCHWPGLL